MRYAFSLQGFPFSKSIQGYLKCQNCGTDLRITGFGKQVWLLFTVTVIVLAMLALFYRDLFSIIGFGATAVYWVLLIFLVVYVFSYGMWKHAILKQIDTDTTSKTDPSI